MKGKKGEKQGKIVKFKSRAEYKKLMEVFGWRLAPHTLAALWQIHQAPPGTTMGHSIARQNFKTEEGAVFLFEGALQGESGVFFSHSADLQREMMRRLAQVCKPLIREGIVARVNDNAGAKEIEFTNGAIIFCRVRTTGATVGLAKIGRIVFDEAQKMSQDFEGDARPIMTHGRSKKVLMTGTPPTRKDIEKWPENSFAARRAKGGKYWLEVSAGVEYTPELRFTVARARKANPAIAVNNKILDAIKADLETLKHERFWQERMGLWLDFDEIQIVDPELGAREVAGMMTTKGSRATSGFACGVGILPNSERAFLTMSDGRVLESSNSMGFEVGTGDLDQLVDAIWAMRRQIRVVLLPANARGKALANLLNEKRMKKHRLLTLPETGNRLARFCAYARAGKIHVYDTDRVRLALSSFWIKMDARSGSGLPAANDPAMEAQTLSLVLATEGIGDVERRERRKKVSVDLSGEMEPGLAYASNLAAKAPRSAQNAKKVVDPTEGQLTPRQKREARKAAQAVPQEQEIYKGDWSF